MQLESNININKTMERPEKWSSTVSWWSSDLPYGANINKKPLNATFLFQAGWAWTATNTSIFSFYISNNVNYWLLHYSFFDEDNKCEIWNTVASVPISQANKNLAAFWLVVDYLEYDRDNGGSEEWFMITEGDLFSEKDIDVIANQVWS